MAASREDRLGGDAGEGPPVPGGTTPGRIGDYAIRRELGRGGMGVVYEAKDPRLGRWVALKRLPQHLGRDHDSRARFEREARLLAGISHPNIATVFSLEESDGARFLTMELVPGETLAARLRGGALPLRAALQVCRQVAAGLEGAHRCGVIHRDLHPRNIMLTSEGDVKLLDFGLARAAESAAAGQGSDTTFVTSATAIMGTPGYMSPEQYAGAVVDARADVWAFGCILYECLTGHRALAGESPADIVAATFAGGPDWRALPSETPPRVQELLRSCLARSVPERLGDIAIARRSLEEALAQEATPRPGDTRLAPSRGLRHNLPLHLSGFVGREREKAEIQDLLGTRRLVTLTGAGGSGKTRLAVEVAAETLLQYPDGTRLVELAALTDPALVAQTVGAALEVHEEPGRAWTETIASRVGGARVLLILDNAEHLLPACADLAEALLGACPGLRIMVTSREALGVSGEQLYPVRPLAVPAAGDRPRPEDLEPVESVRLLLERVRTVDADFRLDPANAPAVAQICRRLDGIPLALELAAARFRALPVDEIARRLDDRFRLLTAGSRGALPRHRTLRALVDWSYSHLTPSEQAMLRRLSVLAGGWTLEAAERVGAGSGIEAWGVLDLMFQLVAKSMVERDERTPTTTGVARYRMLESIREYAHELLVESGEVSEVSRRHREYFLDFARSGAKELQGSRQGEWLARLDADHDNLRRALQALSEDPQEIQSALELAGSLGRFWMVRGYWSEGRRACLALVSRADAREPTLARASALTWAGILTEYQGDLDEAVGLHEESLAIRRARGDERGVAYALNSLGAVAEQRAELAIARDRYEESLAIRRKTGDQAGIAQSLNNLGVIAMREGAYDRAQEYYEESLAIRRESGNRRGIAQSMHNLGTAYSWLGQLDRAAAMFREALPIFRELGDRYSMAGTITNLGAVACWADRLEEARGHFEEALGLWAELNMPQGLVEAVEFSGVLLGKQGRSADGVRLLSRGDAIRTEHGLPMAALEKAYMDRVHVRLRAALGDEAFERAWKEGGAISTEEAVSIALGKAAEARARS
jgi:non-specific serine/threonine protein kinase